MPIAAVGKLVGLAGWEAMNDQVETSLLSTITLIAAVSVLTVVFIFPRSFAALEQAAQNNLAIFSRVKKGLDILFD